MDIHPEDYTQVTSELTIGQIRKVPHLNCSTSNVLRIENSVEGYKMYCFKCRKYLFVSTFNSPKERARRKVAFDAYKEAKANSSLELPLDFSQNIPSKGLHWLGQGGWTISMIRHYNIGYSEKLDRIVIPVQTSGYLARAVESWQRPKYLEKVPEGVMWESRRKNSQSILVEIYGKSKEQNYSTDKPVESEGYSEYAVVTEDILSAGRCGNLMKAYALLGTSLGTTQLSTLMNYKKIHLWLDPDKGGYDGVKKAINRLRLFSEVHVVNSSVDPKKLTNKEIKECLR